MGGGVLHVHMFAHNKSGIAYQGRNLRPETVVNHRSEPHQQPRVLTHCVFPPRPSLPYPRVPPSLTPFIPGPGPCP
jgi:hypothetical protein